MSDNTTAANALHAAETWLQRIGADPAAVAVVTISPAPAVGYWQPGAQHVRTLPDVDDAAAEFCEAAGPLAGALFQRVPQDIGEDTAHALRTFARLQLLVHPAGGTAELRLAGHREGALLAAVELHD